MNEQTARHLLMEYLYEEISTNDKKKLDTYLADHPDMRQELDELKSTRAMLKNAPKVEPEKKITLTEPREPSAGSWWSRAKSLDPSSAWGKAALAAAACLILLLVAASVINLDIQSTRGGVSVHFGYGKPPQPRQALFAKQTDQIIQTLRRENTAILTEYADMLNKQNQRQLREVVQYFEQQRKQDLMLINKNLKQVQLKGQYRWAQTNQMLGELIQTSSDNQ